jgi:hypothetical protein
MRFPWSGSRRQKSDLQQKRVPASLGLRSNRNPDSVIDLTQRRAGQEVWFRDQSNGISFGFTPREWELIRELFRRVGDARAAACTARRAACLWGAVIRCFAPAVFRHSTPYRELPSYFGISGWFIRVRSQATRESRSRKESRLVCGKRLRRRSLATCRSRCVRSLD